MATVGGKHDKLCAESSEEVEFMITEYSQGNSRTLKDNENDIKVLSDNNQQDNESCNDSDEELFTNKASIDSAKDIDDQVNGPSMFLNAKSMSS